MWFGKRSIRQLVTAVLAMAVSSMAAAVAPMYFEGIPSDKQQEYWDYLMKYKMFGVTGIEFMGQEISVTDKVGWFGTARGDFVLNNGNHEVGGPILIGGNVLFTSGDNNERFTTGPTRVTGSMTGVNYGPGSSFVGTTCVAGSWAQALQNETEKPYPRERYGDCPSMGKDSVPQIRQDLRIPLLDKSKISNRIDPITVNNDERYIYVPAATTENAGPYDVIVSSIDLVNTSTLYVRMPKDGRITRIFIEDRLSINSTSTILVQYEDSVTAGKYNTVPLDSYAGDLLIYIDADFALDARSNAYPMQGTFISTKTIWIKQGLALAGQLLANYLKVDFKFNGSNFHYVPFDSPKWPSANQWGELFEGTAWVGKQQQLHVTLSKVPETDVTFNYCFQFKEGASEEELKDYVDKEYNWASEEDIVISNKVPLCRLNQRDTGRFYTGDATLASQILLEVFDDGDIEDMEYFKIKIDSLEGARFEDKSRNHSFDISITDDDRIPACKDTVITGKEDEIIKFADIVDGQNHYYFPAYQNDGVIPLSVYFEVPIIDVPNQPLTIYREQVLPDGNGPGQKYRPIPQYILFDTEYKPALNENNETNVTVEGQHYDSLTFAIEVRQGVRSEPCKMYIDIEPVNDAPVIDDVEISVHENTTVDSLLLTLVGTDVDSKDLVYSIDSGNADGIFALSAAANDELHLAKKLNYEEKKKHVLKVFVTDGDLKDSAYVTINVIDDNEPPSFNHGDTTFVVNEHTAFDETIGVIKASDVDAADKNKLKFSFVDTQTGSNSAAAIKLYPESGVFAVLSSKDLDYEVQDKYVLKAYVTDVDGLQDSITVTIIVNDINEKPYFGTLENPVDIDSVSISEMAKSGLELLTVVSGDPDTKSVNGNAGFNIHNYYIEDCTVASCKLESKVDIDANVGKIFSIDEKSGLITLDDASTLNYETDSVYYMLVIVKDNVGGVPSLADSMVVKVKLFNVNEPPEFELDKYEFFLEENKSLNKPLGEVKAKDKDLNSVIKYSFAGGKLTDEIFTINESTGEISTEKVFDYESDSLYTMTVVATDNGDEPLTATATVIVKIIDVNETPKFDEPSYAFTIAENAPEGATPGSVSATDPDLYNEKFNKLTYSWNDMTEMGADLFDIDPKTGDITLLKGGVLNADGYIDESGELKMDSTTFKLHVRVADNGNPSLDHVVLVTIEVTDVNEAPVLKNVIVYVDEDTPKGTVIIEQLDGWDPEGDRLTYNKTAGDIYGDFYLSPSGKLRIADDLDYEDIPKYVLTVEVSDGKLTSTGTVTVIVLDKNDPPKFYDDGFEVKEHNKPHTFVGQLTATDEDNDSRYNNLTFSMHKDPSGLFSVTEDGAIYVEEENVLNYETTKYYTIQVRVTDGENPVVATVYIDVLDINEKPVLGDVEVNVDEHLQVGVIATLKASDKDEKERHTYYMIDDSEVFNVISSTGEIVTLQELDYETVQSYTFQVYVRDNGQPKKEDGSFDYMYDTATVTIFVNDVNEVPSIRDSVYTILETAQQDDLVGYVNELASDKDVLDTKNGFHKLSFGLSDTSDVAGAVTEGASSLFKINASTGRVMVNEGAKFDYETLGKKYALKLTVTDQDKKNPLSASSLLIINIEDVPEPPKFEHEDYEIVIDENTPPGTLVGEVKANDNDENENLKYSFDGDKDFISFFHIDRVSGEITVLKDTLDYEKKAVYEAKVVVTDKDGQTDEAKIVIRLEDVDEMPVMDAQKFSIYENNEKDALVGTIKASDLDTAAKFIAHTFEPVSGDTALFSVDENGKIRAKTVMDYEAYKDDGTIFVVNVKVIDTYNPALYVVKPMTIELLNINEDPSVVTKELSVPENSKAGFFIGKLEATDPDGETTFTFDLIGSSAEFKVDPDGSVKVKVSDVLNYEEKSEYTINVRVKDAEGAMSQVSNVKILVIDVNEAPNLNDTTLYISENSPKDTVFAKIVGSDPDTKTEEFRKLTYEMISKKDTFDILPDGSAKQLVELDYEFVKEVVRDVRVCDIEYCDTATVTFVVVNVIEKSNVIITKVNNKDSTWNNPEVIYTNVAFNTIEWIQDGIICSLDTLLEEGPNKIIISYKDPHKDLPGIDTVIIHYSNAVPEVTIAAEGTEVGATNIYTIVETTDVGDTSIYVNKKTNDVTVTIVDPGEGTKRTVDISVELDSVTVPSATLDSVKTVVDNARVTRTDTPASTVYRTPVNGTEVKVSYSDVIPVDGKNIAVEISYLTDKNGEPLKTVVVDENGKVDSVEVITVSYETVVNGKVVTISYVANADDGQVLNMTSEGALTYSSESSSTSANDAVGVFKISYNEVNANGDTLLVSYMIDEKGEMVANEDGDIGYTVTYNYVNKFGNSASKSVVIVLDQLGPKVEILAPTRGKNVEVVYSNYVAVEWTVNGVKQDTLITQGLEKGVNAIVRFYRDKAGNEASDTVMVIMKAGKNIEIDVLEPVTIVKLDEVQEYYDKHPPVDGQNYAVSVRNPGTNKEKQTTIGGDFKPREGEGVIEDAKHLGPTLSLDIKLPVIKTPSMKNNISTGTISGLATLDDLLGSEGTIPLEGADAAQSEKISREEYVDTYCSDEFKSDFRKESDISKLNLYNSKMDVKVWVYTTTGGFVNYYHFAQELNDPDYTNDGGSVQLLFEMTPDMQGDVRTEGGRLLGTGSYVYKVETKLRSELRCSLPPISGTTNKKGDVIKTHEELLKSFGYKRPREK